MKKFREIRVRYTHPAIPPIGIKTNEVYKVGNLLDTYEFNDLIKVMFTPIDTTWDKLEEKSIKRDANKYKDKEVVVEDLEVLDERAE